MAGDYGKHSGKFPGGDKNHPSVDINIKVGCGVGHKPVLDLSNDMVLGTGHFKNDLGSDTNVGAGTLKGDIVSSHKVGDGQMVRNLPPHSHSAKKMSKREDYIKKISMDY